MFSVGRYFIFIEVESKGNTTLCYSGEGNPHLFLKEEVKVEGYRNDYTEYVPISKKKDYQFFPSTMNNFARSDKQNSEMSISRIKNDSASRIKLNNQLR